MGSEKERDIPQIHLIGGEVAEIFDSKTIDIESFHYNYIYDTIICGLRGNKNFFW